MDISWVAVDREAAQQAEQDPRKRKKLLAAGRPLRSDGRAMSDDQLVAKIRSLDPRLEGLEGLERGRFRALCEGVLSAEALTKKIDAEMRLGLRHDDIHWLWICLTALWERWLPDRPSFEMLDDWTQEGYGPEGEGESAETCAVWLRAFDAMLSIMDSAGMRTVDDFDRAFRGTQSAFNWVQDLEMALANGGLDDPELLRHRIRLADLCIERLYPQDSLTCENMRRSKAESLFRLGETRTAENLFEGWLRDDPQWGWGWIGWSDLYWLCPGTSDYAKAEAILKKALAADGLRDRPEVLDRLKEVRQQGDLPAGSEAEAQPRGREADSQRAAGPTLAAKGKVGRNEPCPCGSGLKYKRCCGA